MKTLTLFEFDHVVSTAGATTSAHSVPPSVFEWLENQCCRTEGANRWLRLTSRGRQRSVQFTSYVGVIRAPCGFQIEILPKIGKADSRNQAQSHLLKMLKCLAGFSNIKTNDAELESARAPLLEVFIQQFLQAVDDVVKRGVRSDYVVRQDDLFALRGKLIMAQHLKNNLFRKDRFFTEHDEFIRDRAENRLIHSALRTVLSVTKTHQNQRLARELLFVFAEIPTSSNIAQDFQRIRLDRGMSYYSSAMMWARLILSAMSPVSTFGTQSVVSLLFPMERVFEAYVQKHLAKQLRDGFHLKPQPRTESLVGHKDQRWFKLKPDFLIKQRDNVCLVLDSKWKLLDSSKSNAREKYNLSQNDFYQLQAYGHHYLPSAGDLVLIYPKTESFREALPVFSLSQSNNLRLWVLPFCLENARLELPEEWMQASSVAGALFKAQ